eukprot:7384803-Prymnesium_polylepis.4
MVHSTRVRDADWRIVIAPPGCPIRTLCESTVWPPLTCEPQQSPAHRNETDETHVGNVNRWCTLTKRHALICRQCRCVKQRQERRQVM